MVNNEDNMTQDVVLSCKNCYFYLQVDEQKGECRRYPPQIVPPTSYTPPGDWESIGNWPVVYTYMWCGEFKNRD